jgi:hypothetical protein
MTIAGSSARAQIEKQNTRKGARMYFIIPPGKNLSGKHEISSITASSFTGKNSNYSIEIFYFFIAIILIISCKKQFKLLY